MYLMDNKQSGIVLGNLAHPDGDACGLLDRGDWEDEREVVGLDHHMGWHIAERNSHPVEADLGPGEGCR